jgi:hypothetical protein
MTCVSTVHSRGKLRTINAAVLHRESQICSNSPGKYTVTGFSTRRSPLDQQFARDTRLIKERYCLAGVGQIPLGHTGARVCRDSPALLGWLRGDREHFTQVHLGRIGLGRKALALGAEDLAPEPIELLLERGDRLGLRLHETTQFCSAHRHHFRVVR